MFLEMLPRRAGEEAADRQMLWDDMMRLNGKQTIYQMMQLAERIRERGGQRRNRCGTSMSISGDWMRR